MSLATRDGAAVLEQVIIKGDLALLEPEERVQYYAKVCESVGLNPFTKPFEYIKLNGKLTLYALKGATDQLRAIYGISIETPKLDYADDLFIASVVARDKTGRTDSDTGAVVIAGLKGEAKANAIMKAITKAKRRVTLSMCGLGMLDETEVASIPSARHMRPEELGAQVDGEGNILQLPDAPSRPAQPALEPQSNGVTPSQVKALSIALKEAEFGTTDEAKAQGRAFLAWMVNIDELASVKNLTKAQAQRALDQLGSGENGEFRTQREKLQTELEGWHDFQSGRELDNAA